MDFELLDPKVDFAFKQLFGSEHNKDLLLSLLNAVLQHPSGKRIESLTLGERELPGEWQNDKSITIDVQAEDEQGNVYDIEMQMQNHKAFVERILFYWSRIYGTQMPTGTNYPSLRPVITVVFVNFVLFHESECFRSKWMWCNEQGDTLTEHGQIYFLELPKVAQVSSDSQPLEH